MDQFYVGAGWATTVSDGSYYRQVDTWLSSTYNWYACILFIAFHKLIATPFKPQSGYLMFQIIQLFFGGNEKL